MTTPKRDARTNQAINMLLDHFREVHGRSPDLTEGVRLGLEGAKHVATLTKRLGRLPKAREVDLHMALTLAVASALENAA